MKITKEQFKNIVREVMTEESEYQKFFAKALEKTGKSIPDMSDEEKKAFFNKIDAAWDGKGEKNEGNAFGAAVSDAKEKGEDEFEVGGEKFKVEEAKSTTISAPGEWVAYLSMTRGKKLLKTFNTARGAKQFLSKNVDKLLGGSNVESVGIMTKKQWDEREAKYAIEGVNELKKLPSGNFSIKVGYPTFADYEKKAKVGDTILKYDKRGGMIKSFVKGSELDKNAEKYLDKVNNITSGVVYLSKKGMKGVAQVPDYEKKEVGVLVLESKSINEEKYTVIDPKGNSLGTAEKNQVVMAAKKKGGEKTGHFVVSAKNALKARRALEKFKGDFKNPKLKDIMAGLYESVKK